MTPTLPDWNTLRLLLPELCLVAGMVGVLIAPMFRRGSTLPAAVVAWLATLGAAWFAYQTRYETNVDTMFSHMVSIDPFSQYIKILIATFTFLILVQWWFVGRLSEDRRDAPDFLCLILGAAMGMMLMASASNLLMMAIAIESVSLPSYALAGLRKKERAGSEGALRFVVFGAASAGLTMFGISLLYGVTGSLDFGHVAARLVELSVVKTPEGTAIGWAVPPMAIAGLLGLFVGLSFKLSAVPMHFWCPDVFEASPTEVTTFLAVASKGAAVGLLARVLVGFTQAEALLPASLLKSGTIPWVGLTLAIAGVGVLTTTWGNFCALGQTNLKRLLAYSSIAHTGYLMMACCMIPVIAPLTGGKLQLNAVLALLAFYLLVYFTMNLGAFTVVALIEARAGVVDMRDFPGLMRRCPVLVVLLGVFLLSLFGLPGLGGFWAKIYLMKVLASLGPWGFVLVAAVLLNTLLSLYFYLRPMYFAIFVPERETRPAITAGPGLALAIPCAAVLLWIGILPNQAMQSTAGHGQMLAMVTLPPPPAPATKPAATQPRRSPSAQTRPAATRPAETQPARRNKPAPATQPVLPPASPASQPATQPINAATSQPAAG